MGKGDPFFRSFLHMNLVLFIEKARVFMRSNDLFT